MAIKSRSPDLPVIPRGMFYQYLFHSKHPKPLFEYVLKFFPSYPILDKPDFRGGRVFLIGGSGKGLSRYIRSIKIYHLLSINYAIICNGSTSMFDFDYLGISVIC